MWIFGDDEIKKLLLEYQTSKHVRESTKEKELLDRKVNVTRP